MSTVVEVKGALAGNFAGDVANSAKPETIIGEFMRNGFEAPLAGVDKEIEWGVEFVKGAEKLTITNNGKGMSYDQLYELRDLAVQGEKGSTTQRNYGMGARISGLSASPKGVVYRSSFEGKVWESTFSLVERDGAHQIIMSDIQDVTHLHNAEDDWVTVVFLGRKATDRTAVKPWVGSGEHPVPEAVRARFFRFPSGVKVKCHSHVLGEHNATTMRTLHSTEEYLMSEGYQRYEVVEAGDCLLHFGHIDPTSKAVIMSGRRRTAGGIVFHNEVYDITQNTRWADISYRVGMAGIGKVVSMFIEIPADYEAHNDIYRSVILDDVTKEVVRIESFADIIKSSLPDWVLVLIAEAEAEAAKGRDDEAMDMIADMIRQNTPSRDSYRVSKRGTLRAREGDDIITDVHGGEALNPGDPHDGGGGRKGVEAIPDEDGDMLAEEAKLWMPEPDVLVISEGHPEYGEVQNAPVHVNFYGIGQKTKVRIRAEYSLITNEEARIRRDVLKGRIVDAVESDKLDELIRAEVHREAIMSVMRGLIGTLSVAKAYRWHDAAVEQAMNDNAMSAHLSHIPTARVTITAIARRSVRKAA